MNPLRPKIIVTPAVLNDPDRMRHVLAHELSTKSGATSGGQCCAASC